LRYLVRHRTDYRYDAPVFDSHNEVRLRPLDTGVQRLRRFAVTTTPRARLFAYRDWLGNTVHYFHVRGGHDRLTVVAESEVEVADPERRSGPGPTVGDFRREAGALREQHHDFVVPSRRVPALPEVARLAPSLAGRPDDEPLHDVAVEAMERTRGRLAYVPRATRVDTPLEHALDLRKGVCQDLAHLGVAILRHMGIPGRYVSGYLRGPDPESEEPPGSDSGQWHEGPGPDRGAGTGEPHPPDPDDPHAFPDAPDFHEEEPAHGVATRRRRPRLRASHAWVEAYLPGRGWVALDPTHTRPIDTRYVKIAVGRDYDDVVPVKGIFRGKGKSRMRVHVDVIQLPESRPEAAEEPI